MLSRRGLISGASAAAIVGSPKISKARVLRGSVPTIQTSAASISGFGDSITTGVNASTSANWYINLLGGFLGATVNNQGISGSMLQGTGSRAGNGLGRWSTALTGANKTEMVFILYATNDALHIDAPAPTVAAYLTDFQTIVSGLLAAGYTQRTIIVGSLPWVAPVGFTHFGAGFGGSDAVVQSYRNAAMSIANVNGLFFADIYTVIKNNPAFIDPTDGVHPLDAGHAAIAAAFRTAGRV